jgi:LmbE family N-acetylglucosaminyl deacetylase
MHWVYLSPHLDDAALSCGGLIWEQVQAGKRVSIWTVCAGDAPEGPLSAFAEELHARWGTGSEAGELRRQEDMASCTRLGADWKHFPIPDCIYRGVGINAWGDGGGHPGERAFYYPERETIFGALHPQEAELVQHLGSQLAEAFSADCQVVCPLAMGGHVDHRLTRAAAEMAAVRAKALGPAGRSRRLWYYADYPYALEGREQIEELKRQGWRRQRYPVSASGLEAWAGSVAAHRSQISTFWPDPEAMRKALQDYYADQGGVVLWQDAGAR